MTKKEMSEIFGMMLLAWPNAEMFKGGLQKLKPTVELWAACLPEIDFRTGQQALREICRTCKFPPTIAEFREAAERWKESIEAAARIAWDQLRSEIELTSLREAYAGLPPDHLTRLAINDMGGPERLMVRADDGFEFYNYDGFLNAYRRLLQRPETQAKLRSMVTLQASLPTKGGGSYGQTEGPKEPAPWPAG